MTNAGDSSSIRRVWFAAYDLGNLGGIQTFIDTLAAELHRRGYGIGYLTLNEQVSSPVHPGEVFYVNRFATRTSENRLAAQYPGTLGWKLAAKRALTPPWRAWRNRRLRRFFNRLSSHDCVIFTEPLTVEMLIAAGYRRPDDGGPLLVAQAHNSLQGMLNWGFGETIRRIIDDVDVFLVLSDSDVVPFSQHLGRPVEAMPNPCSIEASRPADTAGEREIVHLGRLAPEKQVDMLIRAFDMVADHEPEWRLSIYGAGVADAELRAQAATTRNADRIAIHGRLDDPARAYASASLAALASDFEGVPYSLIEAARCGVPAVATPSSAAVTAFVSECGYLVPEQTDAALARVLHEAMTDTPRRAALAAVCRTVGDQYSAGAIGDRWESLFARYRPDLSGSRHGS